MLTNMQANHVRLMSLISFNALDHSPRVVRTKHVKHALRQNIDRLKNLWIAPSSSSKKFEMKMRTAHGLKEELSIYIWGLIPGGSVTSAAVVADKPSAGPSSSLAIQRWIFSRGQVLAICSRDNRRPSPFLTASNLHWKILHRASIQP